MPKRPKAGDPELLLVSFCDIVTVTTAALFMAMVITIQEAMKVPVLKGTPRVSRAMATVARAPSNISEANKSGEGGPVSVNKKPVYFECRNQMIFPINYTSLFQQVRASRGKAAEANKASGSTGTAGLLSLMQSQTMGDDYYIVHPSILIPNEMSLEPRPEAKSETEAELEFANKSQFHASLKGIDHEKQYVVFLVRDDSFSIFRRCRRIISEVGLDSGWEYLDDEQPIKFGGIGGVMVMPQ